MQKNYIQPLYLTAYTKINSTRMEVEIIIINELCQTEKDIVIYHLCMESKKIIQMILFTKQKWTQRHRKQTYGYRRGREGGVN